MPSPAGPAELLADLSRALRTLGVRWYVFGAQAVLIWGRPRMTTDVDVTVRLESDDNTSFAAAHPESDGLVCQGSYRSTKPRRAIREKSVSSDQRRLPVSRARAAINRAPTPNR